MHDARPLRLIGLDPGLRHTGWGVIDVVGNRLTHVADGAVHSDDALSLAERLTQLHDGLVKVIERYRPDEAAVEETFVNKNAASTLKLGMARGVVLLVPAQAGLRVAEYSTNLVKKSVVGAGHADKTQVQVMVRMLVPGAELATADAADALAVAICHAHHAQTRRMWVPPAPPVGHNARRRAPAAPPAVQAGPRLNLIDAETRLWRHLRGKKVGGIFRRQEPLLGFTVDFVCHEHRLVIELAGDPARLDELRAQRLAQAGFRVLRFGDTDLTDNFDGVVETIAAALPLGEERP